MKKHKHHNLARRKMSRILDEIYTALLHYGSREIAMRVIKEDEGLHLFVCSDFSAEHLQDIERMSELLQPAMRSDAMVEEYWELAGEDQYSAEGELSLVGQMADAAELCIDGNRVEIKLFVAN